MRLTFILSATLLFACGGEDLTVPAPVSTTGKFSTSSKIQAFLDGKTLSMVGPAIPSHPNGFDEDVNYGQATQCYRNVTMKPQGGRIQVVKIGRAHV